MRSARANFLLVLFLLALTGCDQSGEFHQTRSDRQDCLEAYQEPGTGIGACTRLLHSTDRRLMKSASAYYYRAQGFIGLQELEHTRIDLKKVLSLEPDHRFAKEALDGIPDS